MLMGRDKLSLEKLTRLMEMSVVERLQKNRACVKIVEAVRLPENDDGL